MAVARGLHGQAFGQDSCSWVSELIWKPLMYLRRCALRPEAVLKFFCFPSDKLVILVQRGSSGDS